MRTVIAIPSDQHSGSTVGLMPPEPWPLVDGGSYTPSHTQHLIWDEWIECWEFARELRKRSRLIVIANGDATEGNHHHTTQVVSGRMDEQEAAHIACMDRALKIAKFGRDDALYYIRGTEAHTDPGAQSEERIARDLGAIGERENCASWYHLRLKVNGVLFDIAHHPGIGVGSRYWTKGNSLRSMIKHIYMDSLDAKQPIPRYWIRSHDHEWSHEAYGGRRAEIDGFLTPAFQAKTGYGHKVASHKMLSDIGMLIVVVEDDGRTWWECPRLELPAARIVEA
jgi:hypothetical protein